MPYTTDKSFEGWIDVPLLLPQTEIYGNQWIIVGSLCLTEGFVFEWRAAQMRLVASSGLAVTGTLTLSLIQSFDPATAPWNAPLTAPAAANGAVLVEPSLSLAYPYNCNASIAARDVTNPLEISVAGLYSLVLGFQINDPTGLLDPLTAVVDVAVAAQGRLIFSS